MQEDGPPWPAGTTIRPPFEPKPKNLWQSMGLVGPYGPRYFRWWKDHPTFTLALHLFLPITLPIYTLIAVMNWLTYATEQKVQWPAEILDALGKPLTEAEIRLGKGGELVER